MNRTERIEEPLIEQAMDNAYESNFDVASGPVDNIYPPLPESKRLIQAMLDNPELRKLGEIASGPTPNNEEVV